MFDLKSICHLIGSITELLHLQYKSEITNLNESEELVQPFTIQSQKGKITTQSLCITLSAGRFFNPQPSPLVSDIFHACQIKPTQPCSKIKHSAPSNLHSYNCIVLWNILYQHLSNINTFTGIVTRIMCNTQTIMKPGVLKSPQACTGIAQLISHGLITTAMLLKDLGSTRQDAYSTPPSCNVF